MVAGRWAAGFRWEETISVTLWDKIWETLNGKMGFPSCWHLKRIEIDLEMFIFYGYDFFKENMLYKAGPVIPGGQS